MNEQHSKWQTREIAETFVEGVRGAIPGAKLQLEVISKIISAWCPHPSRILTWVVAMEFSAACSLKSILKPV